MNIDFVPIQETGVSIRLPRLRHGLRVFLIFRATQKTKGVTSGGILTRPARAVRDGEALVGPYSGADPG